MRKLQELALGVRDDDGTEDGVAGQDGTARALRTTPRKQHDAPGEDGTEEDTPPGSGEKGMERAAGGRRQFCGGPKSPPPVPKEETELQRRAREDRRTRPSRRTLYWEVMKMRLEEHLQGPVGQGPVGGESLLEAEEGAGGNADGIAPW